MSQISVNNLTFAYDGSFDNVFEDVSFVIDTSWKLGFVGRNGRGKTTFLKLLMGKYEYSGKISSNVEFDYFPFEISDKSKSSTEIVEEICPNYEFWKLCREVSLLNVSEEALFRQFDMLSKGEQTKILLAALFLKENNFLLIDEPTNHLDVSTREVVAKYLNSKNGYILVSHDRALLDYCIDHVLSINRTNIEVQQGNFSSWMQNKKHQDNFETSENEKLKKDIKRLEKAAKQTADWSNKVEKTKYGGKQASGLRPDRGYVGHKAAKMMKRSISAQNRKEKAIEDKSHLLKNIETADDLKLHPLFYRQNRLIDVSKLSIFYGENEVCNDVNFIVENGDRIAICGKNGCGKSSVLKLILGLQGSSINFRDSPEGKSCFRHANFEGQSINFTGEINISSGLKVSYVSQDTSYLRGNLTDFCKDYNIDESLFKAILRKLDFSRTQFSKNIEDFSGGQKKKVLIAKSLCEEAHLYIWDEPLNFIDVLSRIQIENLILEYKPTMIFVEHDKIFSEKIATQIVKIKRMV